MTSIDLLVMPHGFTDGLSHHDLYSDDWVCLVSADNPDVGTNSPSSICAACPGWPPTTGRPHQPRRPGRCGCSASNHTFRWSPRTSSPCPPWSPVHARIALLQRRLADDIPAELGVRVLPCPFEVGPLVEAIWWHPMYDDDPEHHYLRDVLIRVAGRLTR